MDFEILQVLSHLNANHMALALTSLGICLAIIASRKHMPLLAGRSQDLGAVQSTHVRNTPRVGGIAIFAALLVSLTIAPGSEINVYVNIISAAGILFAVGLFEDLGLNVPPKFRLLAAIVASFCAILMLGTWIPRTDIPVVDVLLKYWFVGAPVTLLITAGIANGFNLIDGVNGLAAFTAMSAALALCLIAGLAGYSSMVQFTTFLLAIIFGFFLMNYPFGLIFLGDAGAYTIGFVLSWCGIAILIYAPEVSPWALLLTMFWPICDMLMAIFRRFRSKSEVSHPDRMHMHQMVMRAMEICMLGQSNRNISNPLATLVLAPFIIIPPLTGVYFWNQSTSAFLSTLVFGTIFCTIYAIAPSLIRRRRRRSVDASLTPTRSMPAAE